MRTSSGALECSGSNYRALDNVGKHDFRRIVLGLKEGVDEIVGAMEENDAPNGMRKSTACSWDVE
jgi:hypothetical protein